MCSLLPLIAPTAGSDPEGCCAERERDKDKEEAGKSPSRPFSSTSFCFFSRCFLVIGGGGTTTRPAFPSLISCCISEAAHILSSTLRINQDTK